jgi:cytochrome P450
MKIDSEFCDGFAGVRPAKTTWIESRGEPILMLIDWRAVRDAAKNWRVFSSDAPLRVPIPSEEAERTVRQLPIELDPPSHTEIRRQLEPWFRRPADVAYRAQLESVILSELDRVKASGEIDLVRDFALPLQSRALALLLNMPEAEAETWIGWGTHVFRDGEDAGAKGRALEQYISLEIERARSAPGDDFFSALHTMTLRGETLSDDDMSGIANLVFAGGRDTIINIATTLIVYFADRRDDLVLVARTPERTNLAVEELLRATSPLTHIGRLCRQGAQLDAHAVAPNGRVSLCWAAANYDTRIFSLPEQIDLARSPNPHVAFGSGPHNCLGAHQARAVLRALIRLLAEETESIKILKVNENSEKYGAFSRRIGFAEARAIVS